MTIAAWYRPVYDKLRISKRFASRLDVLNIPDMRILCCLNRDLASNLALNLFCQRSRATLCVSD
jgi:hypothetical protein